MVVLGIGKYYFLFKLHILLVMLCDWTIICN